MTGRVYVHSGRTGERLLTLSGTTAGEGFGIGTADVGDVNGDGHDDLLLGAWQNAEGAPSGGKCTLHSGRDGAVLASWVCTVAQETFGFDTDDHAADLDAVSGERAEDVADAVLAERERRLGTKGKIAADKIERARLDEVVVHGTGAVRAADLAAVPVAGLLLGRSRPFRLGRPLPPRRGLVGRQGRFQEADCGQQPDAGDQQSSHDSPPRPSTAPQHWEHRHTKVPRGSRSIDVQRPTGELPAISAGCGRPVTPAA